MLYLPQATEHKRNIQFLTFVSLNICIFQSSGFWPPKAWIALKELCFSQWKSWDKINILEGQPPDPPRSSPILPTPATIEGCELGKSHHQKSSFLKSYLSQQHHLTSGDVFFFGNPSRSDPVVEAATSSGSGYGEAGQDAVRAEKVHVLRRPESILDSIQLGMLKWEGKGLCPPKVLKITGVAWACVFLLELPPQKKKVWKCGVVILALCKWYVFPSVFCMVKNWWSVPHSTYPYMQARSRNSLYFRGVALVDSHGLCVALIDSQTRCTVKIGYNRYLQTKKGYARVDLSTIYALSWAYPFFRSLVGGLFGSPIINLPILTIINPCDTFLNKLGFVSEPLLSILPGSTLKW